MRRLLESRGYIAPYPLLLDYAATKRACLELIGNVIASMTSLSDLVLTWSSHGTPTNDPRQPDGIVEAICPTDCMEGELITAYDIAALFRFAPEGSRILMIPDTCFGLDHQHAGELARGLVNPHPPKARTLIDPNAPIVTADSVVRTLAPTKGSLGWTRTAVFSAAGSNETAADAYIDGSYQGAHTAHLIKCIERNPGINLFDLSRRSIASVKSAGFRQTPHLLGAPIVTEAVWF